MAKRKTTPQRLPDAVREAVERTIQATVGQAEAGAESVAARVREAFETGRPATMDDVGKLRREVQALSKRLDAIEKQLPKRKAAASRKPAASRSTSSARGRSTGAQKRSS